MLRITRLSRATARLKVPSDKSISHRAALLGALASGTTTVSGYSSGQDCGRTLRCVEQLGAAVTRQNGTLLIHGTGGRLKEPCDVLDCGNSGTTMRLLSGVLAGQPFLSVLTGDESLRKRPMRRVVEPLRQMGAQVDGRVSGQNAPLVIRGGGLRPLDGYVLPVASAQVKSCLLLAALSAQGVTSLIEPLPTRDHTERILPLFGASVAVHANCLSVSGPLTLEPAYLEIPGDFSSAAFWLALGAMLPGSDVSVLGVGTNPRRTGFLSALGRMGCVIETSQLESLFEPVSDLCVRAERLDAIEVTPDEVPGMVDELPLIGVCGAIARGTTVVRGAGELRHKESDRISAIVQNLRAMGAEAYEEDDGFIVHGTGKLRGATILTRGDHRIAMAFAIAGLLADGETVLDDTACINVSYPGFLDVLEMLMHKGEVIHG